MSISDTIMQAISGVDSKISYTAPTDLEAFFGAPAFLLYGQSMTRLLSKLLETEVEQIAFCKVDDKPAAMFMVPGREPRSLTILTMRGKGEWVTISCWAAGVAASIIVLEEMISTGLVRTQGWHEALIETYKAIQELAAESGYFSDDDRAAIQLVLQR